MAENVYPVIKTSEEVHELINQNLNKQRAQKIIEKINSLEMQLDHYQKILKRWKKFGKIIRITNLVITGIVSGTVATLGVLTTTGIALPVVVTAILGGYTVIQSSVLEGLNVGMIKRKTHRFTEKCNIIKGYIYKMNFYYEKAQQDGIITLEELEGFNKLVTEFESSIVNKESSNIKHGDAIDMTVLKQMADIEAKLEAEEEIKKKLKEVAKQKLLLNVVS
jgi:hypothetical protein